ncbi:MAG: rod shape-determining protein RodA [Paludibacteraceae bacterium]|nr:rod shape-determining protein RodA [Paludibacteraceae bacterium]
MSTRNSNNIFRQVDWLTIGLFLVLVMFGWMNVLGASYSFDQTSYFSFDYRSGKQLVWIMGALLMGFVILMLDWRVIEMSSYVLYGGMLLLLIATPFLAHDIKGSMSWIDLGPVRLQPAEFAKITTALALSKFMSGYDYKLRSWHDLLIPFIIMGVPMVIIMVMQKETGSALIFVSFFLMFYRMGMTGIVLLIGAAAVVLFVLSLVAGAWTAVAVVGACAAIAIAFLFYRKWKDSRKWRLSQLFIVIGFAIVSSVYCYACHFAFEKILQPHQRTRIEVLLGLKDDPQGAGYNVMQSKIAIGSGGVLGKGFLNGTQTKMNFVPEQATDFIFCTVGEEWGFAGSTMLLILYLSLILRLLSIAERQKDQFSLIFCYCVAGIFLFHLTINVGMVLGLVPVIGIPLPFLSYGGSSLWGFSILLFILLRLDASRFEKMR